MTKQDGERSKRVPEWLMLMGAVPVSSLCPEDNWGKQRHPDLPSDHFKYSKIEGH